MLPAPVRGYRRGKTHLSSPSRLSPPPSAVAVPLLCSTRCSPRHLGRLGEPRDIEAYVIKDSKRKKRKGKAKLPYTLQDDKDLIKWCLLHGDGRPSFDRAVAQGVCAGHSMESLRTRCRQHSMKNTPLVQKIKKELKKANNGVGGQAQSADVPSSKKSKKRAREESQQPLTQAPDSDEDSDADADDSDDDMRQPQTQAQDLGDWDDDEERSEAQQEEEEEEEIRGRRSSSSQKRPRTRGTAAAAAAAAVAPHQGGNTKRATVAAAAAAAAAPSAHDGDGDGDGDEELLDGFGSDDDL
jgi:hypothetical protein